MLQDTMVKHGRHRSKYEKNEPRSERSRSRTRESDHSRKSRQRSHDREERRHNKSSSYSHRHSSKDRFSDAEQKVRALTRNASSIRTDITRLSNPAMSSQHSERYQDADSFQIPSKDQSAKLPSIVAMRKKSSNKISGQALSNKEMALKKRKQKKARIERRSSLDLLDPEIDSLPDGQKQDETLGLIVSPDSPFVTYWASFLYILTIYNLVVIPFRMAFGFFDTSVGFWFFFDLFTDLCFAMDIYLSFHIGFYENGRAVLNLSKIAKKYQRSWFALDVLASFPMDFIQISYDRIVPSARAPKLLRAVHIVRKITIVENQPGVNVTFIRLLKLVFYAIFANHFAACGWYAFASPENFGADEWVAPQSFQQLSLVSAYLRSLYWATNQMAGRGDRAYPTTISQAIFHLSFLAICIVFFAYVVGIVVSQIDTANANAIAFQSRVDYVKQFMAHQGISKKVRHDVMEYFSYLWVSHRGFDYSLITNSLPTSLSNDIQVHLAKDLVIRSPLFTNVQSSALNAIVNLLTLRVCSPGELIIHSGLRDSSMYFVQQGELVVLSTDNEKVLRTIGEGDCFGEMQLFLNRRALSSIQAKTFCQLYEFQRVNLDILLETYPGDAQILIRRAKEYMNMHGFNDPALETMQNDQIQQNEPPVSLRNKASSLHSKHGKINGLERSESNLENSVAINMTAISSAPTNTAGAGASPFQHPNKPSPNDSSSSDGSTSESDASSSSSDSGASDNIEVRDLLKPKSGRESASSASLDKGAGVDSLHASTNHHFATDTTQNGTKKVSSEIQPMRIANNDAANWVTKTTARRKKSQGLQRKKLSVREFSHRIRQSVVREAGLEMPVSKFRRFWERVLITAIIYTVLTVPFRIGFLPLASQRYNWSFVVLDVLTDIILVLDIGLRFYMASFFNGIHPVPPESMRAFYLRNEFSLHLVACLPLDWITITALPNRSLVLRLLRLLRIRTLLRIIFRNRRNLISHSFLNLIKTVLVILLLAHVAAMTMAAIGRSEENESNEWMESLRFSQSSPMYQYSIALIIALQMLTGVGSGEPTPVSDGQVLFTMTLHMVSIFLLAYLFGSFSSFLMERSSIASSFSNKLLSTRQFMEFRQLPPDINARVQKFFDYLWSTMKGIDPQLALSSLPKSLRTSVMTEMCHNIMHAMPLFKGVTDRFIHDLVPRLAYEVFPAHEFIFKKGQMANNKMYFVVRGILSIILDETISTRPFKMIGTGSFFGEIAILTDGVRGASIMTETPSHLLSLSKDDLFVLLRAYPFFEERMHEYAIQRIRRFSKTQSNLSEILQDVIAQIDSSRLVQNRTYKFIKYDSCFVGSELIDWLINRGFCEDRADGITIGVSLYEQGHIRYVNDEEKPGFRDGLWFYRLSAYVDQMAKADETTLQVKFVQENMQLMLKISQCLITSEFYLNETNLLTGKQIMHIIISNGFVSKTSENEAIEFGQRLIDAHFIQSVQEFEVFENSSDFYRLRQMNRNDPQNTGPCVSDILMGSKSAFVGRVVVRGHSTFMNHYTILTRGFPAKLYLFSSKKDLHPQRIIEISERTYKVSVIQDLDSDAELKSITITGHDLNMRRMLSTHDSKCLRDIVLCFSSHKMYRTALNILEAQNYNLRIGALAAQNWITAPKLTKNDPADAEALGKGARKPLQYSSALRN